MAMNLSAMTHLGVATASVGHVYRGLAAGFLDSPDAINSGNSKLLMIFVGLCAFAFLVIATAVVVLVLELLKTKTRVMQIVEELHGKAIPFIDQAHDLVNDVTPKVKDITANVQHISYVVRDKVEEFEPTISAANVTVRDANAKTHEQVVRVNEMITTALNKTTEVAEKVEYSVRQPFREAAGVWTGLKVGFETFFSGASRRSAKAYRAPRAEYTTAQYPPTYSTTSAATPATAAAEAAAAAFARAEEQDISL